MAIVLNDNININSPKVLDYRYGPWNSISDANTNILSLQRQKGLTIGILNGSSVVEYWYCSGITNSDLIIKSPGSLNDKLDLSAFYQYTSNTNTLIGTKLNTIDFNIYSSTTNTLLTS